MSQRMIHLLVLHADGGIGVTWFDTPDERDHELAAVNREWFADGFEHPVPVTKFDSFVPLDASHDDIREQIETIVMKFHVMSRIAALIESVIR